jgi:pilus assembly protein CpaE
VAVYAPRGGSGATFLATHLAAALARREQECVLVDMDPLFGDLGAALGASAGDELRTVADLLPVVEELSRTHVEEVVWRHSEGFGVLLAPEPEIAVRLHASDYEAIVSAVASKPGMVILHLPRALDEFARCGLERADRVLMVLTLDVFSFRDAKRALSVLAELGLEERCEFVVNRASRSEIVPADVRRAFGKPAISVVSVDRGVAQAQDRGRLLPRRGRAARSVDRLAGALLSQET